MALSPATRSRGACANCRRRLFWSPYGFTESDGRLFCNVDCRWTWELKDGRERGPAAAKGGCTGWPSSGERWRRGAPVEGERGRSGRSDIAGLRVWEGEHERLRGRSAALGHGEERKGGQKVEWI